MGYSAGFFRDAWSVVGSDVIKATKSFFNCVCEAKEEEFKVIEESSVLLEDAREVHVNWPKSALTKAGTWKKQMLLLASASHWATGELLLASPSKNE